MDRLRFTDPHPHLHPQPPVKPPLSSLGLLPCSTPPFILPRLAALLPSTDGQALGMMGGGGGIIEQEIETASWERRCAMWSPGMLPRLRLGMLSDECSREELWVMGFRRADGV